MHEESMDALGCCSLVVYDKLRIWVMCLCTKQSSVKGILNGFGREWICELSTVGGASFLQGGANKWLLFVIFNF
ncbi:hypothetical protein K1719_027209 [Acacia pycnantha]|nr:hypothetical protein K1719_027209 [Acacia pycnantha]